MSLSLEVWCNLLILLAVSISNSRRLAYAVTTKVNTRIGSHTSSGLLGRTGRYCRRCIFPHSGNLFRAYSWEMRRRDGLHHGLASKHLELQLRLTCESLQLHSSVVKLVDLSVSKGKRVPDHLSAPSIMQCANRVCQYNPGSPVAALREHQAHSACMLQLGTPQPK